MHRVENMLVGAAFLSFGCTGRESGTETDVVEEIVGPTVVSDPVTAAVEGQDLAIAATATDSDGVGHVTVYYRTQGEAAWDTLALVQSGESWSGNIPGADVLPPALEYYIRAQDASDYHAVSYLPEAGEDAAIVVPVQMIGKVLPFEEDFEDAGVSGIYGLGWSEQSDGFPGYTWGIGASRTHSGAASAEHRRGIDGLDPLADWFVSPVLDFSALSEIQVSWYESGDYAYLSDHTLWISMTSGDPEDGGFELVSDLAAPLEDEWGRSEVIDLTAWAGNTLVWLAWYYEGDYTDAWYIDDVSVEALAPDLAVLEVSIDPAPVAPGETTTVTASITNLTDVDTGDLTVTWEVDPTYGVFDSPTEEEAIGAGGSAEWSTDFTIDSAFPDNTYLPFTVSVTDGTNEWSWDSSIIVGEISTATIEVAQSASGLLKLTLGAGDKDAPSVSIPVNATTVDAGTYLFEVDITEELASLPPAPGPLRWWVEVESAVPGSVSQFDIGYDGVVYVGDDLGSYSGGSTSWFYLPRPPGPVIYTSSTTPSSVAPGDEVDWNVTLWNVGAATQGITTVTLSSSDPDVTVGTADPLEIAADGWGAGELANVNLEFSVAETHVLSTPVDLELAVTDEVESFELSASVAVPWPVLTVTEVEVDDFETGNNDGLLDVGETSNLGITLANAGGKATFASLTCTLSQTGGTAVVTLVNASDTYASISVGTTKTEDDFEIQADSGNVGDIAEFSLSCTDGTGTYLAPLELEIGKPTWHAIRVQNDSLGDAVTGYPFDMKNGRYRSDGSTLEIALDSWTPYDAGTLFLESWMVSTGAEYDFYQLSMVGGTTKLRGYDSYWGTFTTLSTSSLVEVDEDTVLVSLDLATMGLAIDEVSAGFAAGFCGASSYYCDQLPNSWGDPYNSGLNTYVFLTLEW